MDTLIFFLIFCQAFGALAGAFAAVWGEAVYILAMRRLPAEAGGAKIDSVERAHLLVIDKGLRFGMTLFLLSSLAFVVVSYAMQTVPQPAMTASYWIFIALALLIICVSWALARRNISFSFGSAATFTAWWFLACLALGRLPEISFGSAAALYVVLTAIIYAVFHYIHLLMSPKK